MDPRLKDAKNLLFLVWQHCGLPEPTALQYSMMDYLQHGPKRAVIQAFRGCGKSWITSVFILHQLLHDREKRVLLVSASKARADDASLFLRRCITEIPILQHLRPKDDQRDSRNAWDVAGSTPSHAPSVRSLGITSNLLTGSRADLVIADDVESAQNSLTAGGRGRVAQAVKEFDAILTDRKDARVIFLGTPQIEESLYHKLSKERGFSLRVWPARKPSADEEEIYSGHLAPYITSLDVEDGEPTEGSRFDERELSSRAMSLGRSGWEMQYMLNPMLASREMRPLRLSDLIVMDLDDRVAPERVIYGSAKDQLISDLPCVGLSTDAYYSPMAVQGDHLPYEQIVMAIDPSGRGSDELGYCCVGILNSQAFLLASGGMLSGFTPETLEKLARIAERFQPHQIVIENNFGNGMFTQLLEPVLYKRHKCHIEEVRHSTAKGPRICDTVEPITSSHRLIVNRSVIRNDYDSTQGYDNVEKAHCYQLFFQMARVTRQKNSLVHDDRIDALALALGWVKDRMNRDIEEQMRRRGEAKFHKELDQFFASCGGRKRAEPLWMRV